MVPANPSGVHQLILDFHHVLRSWWPTFGEDLEGLLDLYSGCGGNYHELPWTTMSREPLSLFGAKDPVAPILLIIQSPPLAPCGLTPSTWEEMRDALGMPLVAVVTSISGSPCALTMSDGFYMCLPLSFYPICSDHGWIIKIYRWAGFKIPLA